MCAPVYKANLYLERIPARLGSISCVAEKDIFGIFSQSFRGFWDLYEKIGSFNISENMICFNQYGVVKVWINSDLTATEP